MKHLLIMFLACGLILLVAACSQDNPAEPVVNQSDQVPAFLAKAHTEFYGDSRFTGRSDGISTLLPNGKIMIKGETSYWNDTMTDPRATGQSIWYINKKVERDGSVNAWGKGELITDFNGGGKWEMTWHGRVTFTDGFLIVDYVVGTGKEGSVQGLIGKWTYRSELDANEPTGFYYKVTGYIVEN